MSFQDLGLQKEILKALTEKGYKEATPIQLKAIPLVIQRCDILASAQTGTGKTAGFTLPLLQVLMDTRKNGSKNPVRALILTPTRELAAQIGENVKAYGKYLPFKSQVIFGGVNMKAQIREFQNGPDILIATPGRLLDLVSQQVIDLSQIEILVLDEADRMLDMGFIHDIRKVLKLLPARRQNLLFSATFSEEIKKLASGILKNPQTIETAKQNTAAELITHSVYPVDNKRKKELLSCLITSNKWEQILVFTRTKHGANRLAKQLNSDGILSEAIHGNKSQPARTKALADFKSGAIKVLVATDIAARGLDIDQLPYVVNFELPNVPEDYIHRIGRTGRCGNPGWACSLVCIDELKLLTSIERLLKRQIEKKLEPGFEVDPSIAAEPIPNGRNVRPQRMMGDNCQAQARQFAQKHSGREESVVKVMRNDRYEQNANRSKQVSSELLEGVQPPSVRHEQRSVRYTSRQTSSASRQNSSRPQMSEKAKFGHQLQRNAPFQRAPSQRTNAGRMRSSDR